MFLSQERQTLTHCSNPQSFDWDAPVVTTLVIHARRGDQPGGTGTMVWHQWPGDQENETTGWQEAGWQGQAKQSGLFTRSGWSGEWIDRWSRLTLTCYLYTDCGTSSRKPARSALILQANKTLNGHAISSIRAIDRHCILLNVTCLKLNRGRTTGEMWHCCATVTMRSSMVISSLTFVRVRGSFSLSNRSIVTSQAILTFQLNYLSLQWKLSL